VTALGIDPETSRLAHIRYALGQIQIENKWDGNSTPTNWTGYRADLESQPKKAPNKFYSKENLEMASNFISDAIKVSFQKNCPIKLQNFLICVAW
jgi:hypothetical protein